MRRFLTAFGAMCLVGIGLGRPAEADPKFPQGDARRSMGNSAPNRSAQKPAPAAHHDHGRPRPQRRPYYGGVRPYPRPYPPHGYRYPYPYPYWPYYYERYYFAPLYIPAEQLYGPGAVKRFMGVDHWFRPQPNVNIIAPPGGADRQADAPEEKKEEKKPNIRATNQKALSLAWKFIGYGDAHFGNQKYADALQRYRKAVRAAPQLAGGYFRQGLAMAAMGRYEPAAAALKRGLRLDPAWPASDFTLNELYGNNQLAKAAQIDALTKAAQQNPRDADLLFLLGVHLHFDGEPDRAATFFNRAAKLVAEDDGHIRGFLHNDE